LDSVGELEQLAGECDLQRNSGAPYPVSTAASRTGARHLSHNRRTKCVSQPPSPRVYRDAVLLSGRWLTAEAADSDWSDLKTSITNSGWTPLTAVWTLASDYSFHLLVTVVPSVSPSSRETNARVPTPAQLQSLVSYLERFEIERNRTLLSLDMADCFYAPLDAI
jgi:hypothetical protein